MAPRPTLPSVAVVAVHGIGDHDAGASAHAMADLLLRLRHPDGSARYTSFREQAMRLPSREAHVRPMPEALRTTSEETSAAADAFAPGHMFMRELLEHYRGGEPYDTLRLDGQRLRNGEPVTNVHVYEMRWADLSRIGAGTLRIFGELYQLLFHLAELGRQTLDQSRAEFGRAPGWRAMTMLHRAAVWLIASFVPVAWLTMLATVLGVLVLRLGTAARPWAIAACAGLAVSGTIWALLYRTSLARRAAFWLLVPGVGVVAAWAALRWAEGESQHAAGREAVRHLMHLDRALLVAWVVVAWIALFLVYRGYERIRPGVLPLGVLAATAASLTHLVLVFQTRFPREILDRTINLFEAETALTVLAWYAIYALGIAAVVPAWWALRSLDADARARARRVLWTARATLAISAASLLVFTFVLWAATLQASRRLLPAEPFLDPLVPLFAPNGAPTYAHFFEHVLQATAGPGFPMLLYVMSVVGAVLVLAMLPAVKHEAWPARGSGHADGVSSQRLGNWLSTGYSLLAAAVVVLFVAVFLLQPAATLVQRFARGAPWWLLDPLDDMHGDARRIILQLGTAMAAAAVGLLALRARLGKLALGLRPVLDAALDVDNYLREHPRDGTPRARIAERYASLLRYLSNWRDAEGRPYRAIVLAAHSQGTVITADLLGFLRREPDPELDALMEREGDCTQRTDRRLFLFTMGSPLVQLYGWCFPNLYAWTRPPRLRGPTPVPVTARDPLLREDGHLVAANDIPPTARPDPRDLGIVRWVNAYRSGDYVGRALWRSSLESCDLLYRSAPDDAAARWGEPAPMVVVSEDGARTRRELCLGVGAHTHYWDATASAVAVELDLLVQEAASVAGPPPGVGVTGAAARRT